MKTHKKGFTLVELIIAIAISALVMTVLGTISIYAYKSVNSNEVHSELQQDSEAIHSILVNLGTQSDGLSSANISGTQMTNSNFTVSDYKLRTSTGYNGLNAFTIKLPVGEWVDSINTSPTTVNFKPDTDYLEYEFKLDTNTLTYCVVAQIEDTSTSVFVRTPISNDKVLSNNVSEIQMKPLNWADMNDATKIGGSENFLNKMNGAKFIISFNKKKGFANVDYDGSATVKFRNIDK